MDLDLVVQDGTLVTAEEVIQADIGVRGGKIIAIANSLQGREAVSAAGMLVIPGGVDAHVHLEMPAAPR
jgi:dihydropyrimidinase